MSDLSTVYDDDFTEELEDGEGHEGGGTDPHEGEDPEDPDEGDGDEEGDGEGEARQPVEGSQPRRPNDSYRRLRERAQAAETRARESEERASRFEREMTELRTRGAQATQPSPAELQRIQQEEDERLALMTPAEQARYLRDSITREVRGELQRNSAQQQEASDRMRFEALQHTDPLAKKYASEVEQIVREQAQQGFVTPREVALNFLIGKKAREKLASRPAPSRDQRGRVNGSRTQPTRGGTQGRGTGRQRQDDDSEEALEGRLAGQVF